MACGATPACFERLVVQLLVAMGYGGSIEDAGKALGKPGDEGIDGIIKEDRLGLDVIYLQAKRWEKTIGRPDIQQFAGALQGQRARKGVFITTSTFSADARQYAERIDTRIILIDGTELARLMIAHGVGVTPVAVYELKRVDSDFFAEDDDPLTYPRTPAAVQGRCRPPSASLARSASSALTSRSAASSAGYMPPALSDRMVDSISTASKIPLAI